MQPDILLACSFNQPAFFFSKLSTSLLKLGSRLTFPARTRSPAPQQPPCLPQPQLPAVHPIWPIRADQHQHNSESRGRSVNSHAAGQIVIESDPRAASRSPTRPGAPHACTPRRSWTLSLAFAELGQRSASALRSPTPICRLPAFRRRSPKVDSQALCFSLSLDRYREPTTPVADSS